MKKHQLSQTKYQELLEELKILRGSKTEELNEAWRLAVQEGDDRETDAITVAIKLIRENELRIRELKDIIDNAEVLLKDTSSTLPLIGDKLTVKINEVQRDIMLVDPLEADPPNGKISPKTPLGEALSALNIGDSTKFIAPSGDQVEITLIGIN